MTESAFISATELMHIMHDDNVVLMDATYGQPILHTIEGAQIFDIDKIADIGSSMPHMVPAAQDFQNHVQSMGVNKDSHIIVFDKDGFWMAAARAWWMFRLFGHDNVHILDGGLRNWMGDLSPLKLINRTKGNFIASNQPHLIKTYSDMACSHSNIIIDARPAALFDSGHMDDAINIPLPLLINQDGTLVNSETLKTIFAPIMSLDKPIVTSCNSGVTACALAVGLYECGFKNVAVYDGSWIEWKSRHKA